MDIKSLPRINKYYFKVILSISATIPREKFYSPIYAKQKEGVNSGE